MYDGPAISRSPEQETTSPSRYASRTGYLSQNALPSQSLVPPRGQPPSPSSGSGALPLVTPLARDRPTSTFYDPTSENRGRRPGRQASIYPNQSPSLQAPHFSSNAPPRSERRSFDRGQPSPASTYRSQPSPTVAASVQSLPHEDRLQLHNGQNMAPPPILASAPERAPLQHVTRADPMSFSNILSTSDSMSPTASPQYIRKAPVKSENFSHLEASPANAPQPAGPPTFQRRRESVGGSWTGQNGVDHKSTATEEHPTQISFKSERRDSQRVHNTPKVNADAHVRQSLPISAARLKLAVPEKDYQAALARVEALEMSEVEDGNFVEEKHQFIQRAAKRFQDLEGLESSKSKRRRTAQITQLTLMFGGQAATAKEKYIRAHETAAFDEIQQLEIHEERERKKIQQRNRRRENTKHKAEQAAAEFKQKAQETEDRAEKEKLIKDAERAQKRAHATTKLLNGETPVRERVPISPSGYDEKLPRAHYEEDAFKTHPPPEAPSKKAKTGRLKKSKEQKQAEKAAAAAAQEAIERGEEDVLIAPKIESARRGATRESSDLKEAKAETRQSGPSSAYTQMYEQIWRDIARKDVPKLHKIKENSLSTKQSNLRKTAQLASKEARRWQLKTNKSQKDTQARAKRVMREMLSFWKRNEREERDQRKMAEKHELESARKQEADREANRQKRKLNFLISQTELYSHFIGKKVKTDEVERSTDDVTVSQQTVKPAAPDAHAITLPDSVAKPGLRVTNFEDIDFDATDDAALREAAMANAQSAVQEAQNRARAFNNDGQMQSDFDEGEMNFQNPTGLEDLDIPQPEMLSCQLKEYQLKGLNWLVNLYEQGINGILADEMGLGKTVQSISVMAYLAEKHNIWGPFLVIAPASTLHNWQQEIVKFVPTLKVLPYWGNAKDRKVLRKFWDRKHITYTKDSPFHVLVTSYQLVVQDTQYFQKIRWQYMILDEAQAIKSSQSSRWKSLLGFHCRNRLLLTGTPIQNNMQELWALLHFIMPSLFDSHDEFSDWFSKDIESHAQSNTKLNEDQLKRLHMILKPFMLRRIKKHVQKELGDKIEEDVYCDLTYRQRAYYSNLRNKISIMDLIEKAAMGDDNDSATLMNLVMQFRKVCNHPDLFERAETLSPVSFSYFAETASFLREGYNVEVGYSVRNLIEYRLPRLVARNGGRLDIAGPDNDRAGWRDKFLYRTMNIWTPDNVHSSSKDSDAFSWLRFIGASAQEVSSQARQDLFGRSVDLKPKMSRPSYAILDPHDQEGSSMPTHALLNVMENHSTAAKLRGSSGSILHGLFNISSNRFLEQGLNAIEPAAKPAASAPPVELYCASQGVIREKQRTFFNVPVRRALYGISEKTEAALLESKADPSTFPVTGVLPAPLSEKTRYTRIEVPSMRRFVTDSGKLAKLDQLLRQLKEGGHRVLLYFQMTRMINLMEEYLTYRNYKYCRLDGSTKLEDRRDTVTDFQNRPEIFIFLLSTRAGGLGINLTAADTVIFYDSDWNPTIDSQAMDRAHRLGQTRQVTVYRLITRGTIEERIRKRALQKEEVQRVVISGGAGGGVDFNTRSRENRTKDIAMWLADDDQAAEIEKKEAEIAEKEAREPGASKKSKKVTKKKVDMSLDDMYHEGEGHFDDSSKPSGAATPVVDEAPVAGKGKRKGTSKKAKSIREKLAIADGGV